MTKRFLSLLLAICMTFSLSVTAFADNAVTKPAETVASVRETGLCTVTFDTDGHDVKVESQSVPAGSVVTCPEEPSCKGYSFLGWYADAACEEEWSFDTDTVTADTTLYSRWETAPSFLSRLFGDLFRKNVVEAVRSTLSAAVEEEAPVTEIVEEVAEEAVEEAVEEEILGEEPVEEEVVEEEIVEEDLFEHDFIVNDYIPNETVTGPMETGLITGDWNIPYDADPSTINTLINNHYGTSATTQWEYYVGNITVKTNCGGKYGTRHDKVYNSSTTQRGYKTSSREIWAPVGGGAGSYLGTQFNYSYKTAGIEYGDYTDVAKTTADYSEKTECEQKPASYSGLNACQNQTISIRVIGESSTYATFTNKDPRTSIASQFAVNDSVTVYVNGSASTGDLDLSQLKTQIFDAAYAGRKLPLTVNDLDIQYSTPSFEVYESTNLRGNIQQNVAVVYAGNETYQGFTVTIPTLYIIDNRTALSVSGTYTAPIALNSATSVNYTETEKNIVLGLTGETDINTVGGYSVLYHASKKSAGVTVTGWVSLQGGTVRNEQTTIPTSFDGIGGTGTYTFRVTLNGSAKYQPRTYDFSMTLTKQTVASSITLKSGPFRIPVTGTGKTPDYSNLESDIFKAVYDSSTPADLTFEQVSVSVSHALGNQQVTVTYNGDSYYDQCSATTTVEIYDTRKVVPVSDAPDSVGVTYKEDGSFDYDAVRASVVKALTGMDMAELPGTEVLYYATDSITKLNHNYVKLEGEWSDAFKYPAVTGEGTYTFRVTFNGSAEYQAFSKTIDMVLVDGRKALPCNSPVEAEFTYTSTGEIDYYTIKYNVIKAIFGSDIPDRINPDTVSVTYSTDKGYYGIDKNYKITGGGVYQFRLGYDGDYEYKAAVDYDSYVTLNVVRIDSSITLKDGQTVDVTIRDGARYWDDLKSNVFAAIYQNSTPALTFEDVSVSLENKVGSQTVTVSFNGNAVYNGTSASVTVNVNDPRPSVPINETPAAVSVTANDDGSWNYDAIRADIIKNVTGKTSSELGSITVEYNAQNKAGNLNKVVPLEGKSEGAGVINYKSLKESGVGSYEFTLTYAGNASWEPFTKTVTVAVQDNRQTITPKTPVTAELAFTTAGIDYETIKWNVFKAAFGVVPGIEKGQSLPSYFSIQYKNGNSYWAIDGNKKLTEAGTYEFKLSYEGNNTYKPVSEAIVSVTLEITRQNPTLKYNAATINVPITDGKRDWSGIKAQVFEAVYDTSSVPEITVDDVAITMKEEPGTQSITIAFSGDEWYNPDSQNVSLTIVDTRTPITLGSPVTATIVYKDADGTIDYDATADNIILAVTGKTRAELGTVSVRYLATVHKYGSDHNKYAYLGGETVNSGNAVIGDYLTYEMPALPGASSTPYSIQLICEGNATYQPNSAEGLQVTLSDGRKDLNEVFNIQAIQIPAVVKDDGTVSIADMESAIFDALYTGNKGDFTASDFTISYNDKATFAKYTNVDPAVICTVQTDATISRAGDDANMPFNATIPALYFVDPRTHVELTAGELDLSFGTDGKLITTTLVSDVIKALTGLDADKVSGLTVQYQDGKSYKELTTLTGGGQQTLKVSFAGNKTYAPVFDETVTFTFNDKREDISAKFAKDAVVVNARVSGNTIDCTSLESDIFTAAYGEATPLTAADVTITYNASAEMKVQENGNRYSYQTNVSVAYAGSDKYKPFTATIAAMAIADPRAVLTLPTPTDAKLIMTDGTHVNYTATGASVAEAMTGISAEALGTYSLKFNSTLVGDVKTYHAFVDISGGKATTIVIKESFPGITAPGAYEFQLTLDGNATYQPRTYSATVTLTQEMLDSSITLKDGEIPVAVTGTGKTPDYTGIEAKIFEAVYDSSTPEGITADDVTVTMEKKLGTQTVTVTYKGSSVYRTSSDTATVNIYDERDVVEFSASPEAVAVTAKANGDWDYDTIRAGLVKSLTGMDSSDLPGISVTYKAKNKAENLNKVVPLEGKSEGAGVINYKSLQESGIGTYEFTFAFDGSATYQAFEKTVSIEIKDARKALEQNNNQTVTFAVDTNGDWDYAATKANIVKAVTGQEMSSLAGVTVTYLADSKVGVGDKHNSNYVDFTGGWKDAFEYPALTETGTYTFRIEFGGDDTYQAYSFRPTCTLQDGRKAVEFVFNDAIAPVVDINSGNYSYDFSTMNAKLFAAAVKSSTPTLTVDDVTFTYDTSKIDVAQTVTIHYDGNGTYCPTDASFTATITDSRTSVVQQADQKIVFAVGAAGSWDYATTEVNIIEALTGLEKRVLGDVTVTYLADSKVSVGDKHNSNWAPISGGTVDYFEYPAITAIGTYDFQIQYNGNLSYKPCSFKISAELIDARQAAAFEFNDDIAPAVVLNLLTGQYDFTGMDAKLFAAAVKSSTPTMTVSDVTFTYDTSKIDEAQTVTISFAGNKDYRPTSDTFAATFTDSRKTLVKSDEDITFAVDAYGAWDYATTVANIVKTFTGVDKSELNGVTVTYLADSVVHVGDKYNSNWVPINGGTVDLFEYPAITEEGTYKFQVVFAGNNSYRPYSIKAEAKLKDIRPSAEFSFKESVSEAVIIRDDLTYDFSGMGEALYKAALIESTPALAYKDITLTYDETIIDEPQTVTVTFAGSKDYRPTKATFTATLTDSRQSIVPGTEDPVFAVDYLGEWDYATTEKNIIKALTGVDAATLGNVTLTYLADSKVHVGEYYNSNYVSIKGGWKDAFQYPAITEEGTYKFQIEFPGNATYKPYNVKVEAFLKDVRPYATMNFKQGVTVGVGIEPINYGYDFTGVEAKLFDAAYLGGTPVLTADMVTVTYAEEMDVEQDISVFFRHTKDYRDTTVTFKATLTDPRIATSFTLNSNPSVTYDMDPEVLKEAFFSAVINSKKSTMPAYDTNRFVAEYKTSDLLGRDKWVDVRGTDKDEKLQAGDYTIRFRFSGNMEYRPTEYTEIDITIQKATVKVSISSATISCYDPLPAGYVTYSPADDFDIWTFFIGTTNKLTSAAYVNMPDSITNNIESIDKYYKLIYGESLTEKLQAGMTIAEFKELLTKLSELNGKVEDISFGYIKILPDNVSTIIDVITSLPGFLDDTMIGIGTPAHAGLYVAEALALNKNYNDGTALGLLLVKASKEGNVIHWNKEIPESMTLAEFEAADMDAYITHNDRVIKNSNSLNYRYYKQVKLLGIIDLKLITGTPTAAGTYTQKAYTSGGDLSADSITRDFTITE